jgi:ribulose-bisphosphate carboxylase large chain
MTKQKSDLRLAENLKKAMGKVQMTPTELSKTSGVSMATLSRILSGQVNPSLGNMLKIAQVLEVSIDSLADHNALSTVEATNTKQEVTPTAKKRIAKENDILATFILDKTDLTPKEAAKLLENAANGRWVECWTDAYVDTNATPQPRAISSKQIGTKKIRVSLTFPHDMIETGSVTSLLSVVSAAITSTGAKLEDIHIPDVLMRTFKGPAFGIQGIRDHTNKFGRPLLSATMRPMRGLSARMYGRAVYETLKGGTDITCDPTLMHSIPGNQWRERFRFVAEAVHAAYEESNEIKLHAVNVSAPTTEDIIERATYAKDLGIGMILVDSAAIGWSALESLSNWCRKNDTILCGMGSRSLQSTIISEHLLAKLLRLAGCDIVSIGSPLRGGTINRRVVRGVAQTLEADTTTVFEEGGLMTEQNYQGLTNSMPACGGGHNPWHFPRLMDALGDDIIIQCGGSVMGHPWGSSAGSTANRVTVEAIVQARGEGHNLTVDGRSILQRMARHNADLKTALEYWQEGAFLFGVIMGDGDTKTDDLDAVVTQLAPKSLSPKLVTPPKGEDN